MQTIKRDERLWLMFKETMIDSDYVIAVRLVDILLDGRYGIEVVTKEAGMLIVAKYIRYEAALEDFNKVCEAIGEATN